MKTISRVIEGEHGSFLELRYGHATGREFSLVEFHDGTVHSVFASGESEPACAEMTSAVIAEAIRKGTFVVVSNSA